MSNENLVVELTSTVLAMMENENHSMATIADYRRIYDKFIVFCRDNRIVYFTDASGQAFLDEIEHKHPHYDHARLMLFKRTVRRLHCIVEGIIWKPMNHPQKDLPKSCFDMILDQYSGYLTQLGCSLEYCHNQVRNVAYFLSRVDKHGVNKLKLLTAGCIYEISSDWKYSTRARRDVCAFLKYAYVYNIISADLAAIVPATKRHYAIPSVYTPEEVEKVLASVDRSRATGKRNYAILLLAARLGLRRSDIAALTFDNLKSDKITFVQVKTKRKHSLVYLPEVKAAIDDYVANSRPKSPYREIFLDKGGYGPIPAGAVSDAARAAFIRSGIDCKNRRKGSHALRASLATALLAEGNSYFTVQKLLDHANVQTSKAYAKADVEQLRICALPIPAPTGSFKAMLKSRCSIV